MASFRILGLVSKNEIRSREFSFSSRSLRVKIINLDLVSMPEIGGNFFSVLSRSLRVSVRNSRSRLDERDRIGETLILVSRLKKRLSLTTAARVAEATLASWGAEPFRGAGEIHRGGRRLVKVQGVHGRRHRLCDPQLRTPCVLQPVWKEVERVSDLPTTRGRGASSCPWV